MKLYGPMDDGGAMITVHQREYMRLKAAVAELHDMLSVLPDLVSGEDGIVRVVPAGTAAAPAPIGAEHPEPGARAGSPSREPTNEATGIVKVRQKKCLACGNSFVDATRTKSMRYCSEACKKTVVRKTPPARASKDPKQRKCEICGKPYTARGNQKTCSEPCTREKNRRYARAMYAKTVAARRPKPSVTKLPKKDLEHPASPPREPDPVQQISELAERQRQIDQS